MALPIAKERLPVFSIVIPAYNHTHFLPECLSSALVQTFVDWECIVVDDRTTDGTPSCVEGYFVRDLLSLCKRSSLAILKR